MTQSNQGESALAAGDTVREIPAKTYFYIRKQIKQTEIGDYAGKAIGPLYEALKAAGLEPDGPLEFHYLEADGKPEHDFKLHIAVPIKVAKPVTAPYAIRPTKPLRCVSRIYLGSMAGIPAAWHSVMESARNAGFKIAGEGREVYGKFINHDSPDNRTEIQVGIE